jgi:hypothetical protein
MTPRAIIRAHHLVSAFWTEPFSWLAFPADWFFAEAGLYRGSIG